MIGVAGTDSVFATVGFDEADVAGIEVFDGVGDTTISVAVADAGLQAWARISPSRNSK
jgi:hypothetical protein